MARKISVEIVGDSRSFEKALARSDKAARKFQGTTDKMNRRGRAGIGVGGLLGGIGVTAAIKTTISNASDLEEQISKTNVVFEDSAAGVQEWAKTTTNAFGVSRRQALATASGFGALFAPLGIVGEESARQSQRLTELGADLASFYNTDVTAALDAIRSGVVGEAEPLRRYGVQLNETRVQTQAMADTGKKNAKSLTIQEKAVARIKIIYKDTLKPQGDFARTQESLANQSRIAAANIDDLSTELGTGLVPVLADALKKTRALVGWFDRLPGGKSGIDITKDIFEGGIGDFGRRKQKSGDILDFFGIDKTFGGPQFGKKAAKEIDKVRKDVAKQAKKKPITTDMRNQWFDARIQRQLDRVQDLSLRKQLARLKEIAAAIRSRLAATKDITRRLTLEDQLLGVTREQRSVQEQITSQIQAGNQALKDRADAIKSAVIERLQRRQTDILNRRALADAKEQLRIARQEGGPRGIREARRGLSDAQFDIMRTRLENAPATLTRGGRFQFAGVVININGVTDPEQVANRVAAVLKRRRNRTTSRRAEATAH